MRKRPVVPRALADRPRRRRIKEPELDAAELKAEQFAKKDRAVQEFVKMYRDLFDQYRVLVEERNIALTEAINAAKAKLKLSSEKKLSYGDIHVTKSFSRKWDGQMLYQLLDEDLRDQCVQRETVFNVDSKLMSTLIKQDEIELSGVQRALTESTTVKITSKCAKEIIAP